MNTEKAVEVCNCSCVCECVRKCVHSCVCVCGLWFYLKSLYQCVSAGLLSWPPGASVTTDTRAKFTSVKVTYMNQVLGKVRDVAFF